MDKTTAENIIDLAKQCENPGWGGENSLPVSTEIRDRALEFVAALPKVLPPPTLSATVSGHIEMEWPLSRATLKLVFDGTKKVKYFASMGSKSAAGTLPSSGAFANLVKTAAKIKGFRDKK